MTGAARDGVASSPGTLLTRLPGHAQPQTQALKGFEKSIEELKRRYKPVFWPIIVPKAEDFHRWRVQLECGCIHEAFTRGKDDFPDARNWSDPITQRPLPAGEYWCTNGHGEAGRAYRDVVEWLEREVKELPPDPVESPYDGMDPETWANIRQAEPHSAAFWRVRLSCGHFKGQVATDVDWRPEDGPKMSAEKRAAEMRRELEAMWSAVGRTGWPEEGPERDHVQKMLDLRWPRPEPEQDCYTCRHAWQITGYQRIGWLVQRSEPTATPDPDVGRKKAEARLAKAEAEVRRLRDELGLGDHE